ncbi:MAG: amidohydrolase family protein, partial [Candidatus Heimdallarchaeota archaeon]|nr:amidohydrolase family protein [Candidatus Heimdallarchaeota archaeon]
MVKVSDTIIEADYLITCNLTNAVIKDGAVYVVDDRIKAIGLRKDIHKDFSANVVIEGLNKILVPGLVNTHSHSVQTLLRGKADDLALIDWLQKVILPGEKSFTVDEVYTSSLLGFAEMIRTGTTTCNDMLTTKHSNYGIQAAIDSGIRTRIGKMLMDVNNGFPDDMIEHTEKIVEDVIKDIGDYHQTQKNRIKYSLNARFLLSCSP